MAHCDPDVLALAALGEPITDATDVEHLAGCVECRGELESLATTVRVARTGQAPLVLPPESVWQGVQATLASEPVPLPLPLDRPSVQARVLVTTTCRHLPLTLAQQLP